jgi:hypothetical protein
MTLFWISIPFMLVAVAIAVVPLLVVSLAEHRRLAPETDEAPRPNMVTRSLRAEDSPFPRAA